MPAVQPADLEAEITALRATIGGEVDAVRGLLGEPLLSGGEWGAGPAELGRQLDVLRARVAQALRGVEGHAYLRAELATLLSFAKTLHADAEGCRAAFDEARRGIERREQTERTQRERLAAERGALVRQRDALQAEIDQTAERMARDAGGESRRTVPVVELADGISVCSSVVILPRRRFRSHDRWLIMVDHTHQRVVIKRTAT